MRSRLRSLRGCGCLVALALWLVPAWAGTPPLPPPVALAVQQVAPGVWVHLGQIGDFSPDNGGDLANTGFVVGERCVAVIDSGGSFRVGQALLAAIRLHSALPVCFVIATHMHPDHLLGHAAFRAEHPVFVAATRQAAALTARRDGYLSRQRDSLGAQAEGSEVVLADRGVAESEVLELGGRQLELRAWRTAHTDNDLTVLDRASGTLFAGDLLFCQHLPVVDGSLRGWLQVIDALAATAPIRIVPGHGAVPADPQASLGLQRRYLGGLAAEVRAAIHAGTTLQQTVAASPLPDGWQLTALYHRRNVTAAYAELEWED